jgi:replicative DNA helicase
MHVPRTGNFLLAKRRKKSGTLPLFLGSVRSMTTDLANLAKPLPPQNIEAEQALLGALLVNNRLYEKVAEFLKADHFAVPTHGRIYTAISTQIERGQLASAVTLKPFFAADEGLTEVGGGEYLASLETNVVALAGAADYGRAIYEDYLRRELIDVGTEIITEATSPDLDVPANKMIESAEKRLFDLASTGVAGGGFLDFSVALGQAIETAESAFQRDSGISGITSGYRDLDKRLGGSASVRSADSGGAALRWGKPRWPPISPSKPPSSYLRSHGKEGGRVAFFSLEMSAEQLALRILSEQAEIPSEDIRRGQLKERDFAKFVSLSQELQRLPLYIDETPGISVMGMRTRARRLHRTKGLDLIVIDYLQLMAGSASKRNESNRVLEVSEITRGLKMLAKELKVPIIALSQLSRKVEDRDDKKPQLADLRESGSIEQDADVVMFIYREEYYLRNEPGRHSNESDDRFNERYTAWQQRLEKVYNIADVIIAKQRHGPVGTVQLFFDGKFTRFADLDKDRQYSDPE